MNHAAVEKKGWVSRHLTEARRRALLQGIVDFYAAAWGPRRAEKHFAHLTVHGYSVPEAPSRMRAGGATAGFGAGLVVGAMLGLGLGQLMGLRALTGPHTDRTSHPPVHTTLPVQSLDAAPSHSQAVAAR